MVTLNKVRALGNFHRAACRDVRVTRQAESLGQAALPVRADDLALASLRLTVEDVLSTQTELHRQVARLRLDGFEVAEIAGRVGKSRRTVERALHQFRHQLHAALRRDAE